MRCWPATAVAAINLHSSGLSKILSRVFADALASGGDGFLQEKTLHVAVVDACGQLCVWVPTFCSGRASQRWGYRHQRRAVHFPAAGHPARDADSLFFQRLLRIEGDTATGLHLKNFIDALEEPPVPGYCAKHSIA